MAGVREVAVLIACSTWVFAYGCDDPAGATDAGSTTGGASGADAAADGSASTGDGDAGTTGGTGEANGSQSNTGSGDGGSTMDAGSPRDGGEDAGQTDAGDAGGPDADTGDGGGADATIQADSSTDASVSEDADTAAPECGGSERQCEGQQPQQCSDGMWQDDGASCNDVEPCATATGRCEVSSLAVPGGTYARSYDITAGTYTDDSFTATVSGLRVDEFEVTVGQFRRFVEDVVSGWTPAAGAGKHSHLNAGAGVPNSGVSGGYETGWDVAWDAELPSTALDWDEVLECSEVLSPSWTSAAGANEMRPINCVHWYDAYAYCIWSGGFLMTESERNYVATGGSEQRSYPWGEESPNSTRLIYKTTAAADVGSKRAGDGPWGHADLAGNVNEWTLDYYAEIYPLPCADCAQLEPDSLGNRTKRGGDFFTTGAGSLRTGTRSYSAPDWRTGGSGIRCARAPAE